MRTRAGGLSLSDVRGMTSSDAWGLLSGLRFDTGSAVAAALAGQTFMGPHADLALNILANVVLNMGRKQGEKRVELPGPYFGARDRDKRGPVVPAKVKKQLTERLRKFSSIPE